MLVSFLHQVLHWFEHNQPVVDSSGLLARDYAAEAKVLACSLLEEQCGTVALLLTEMAQVCWPGMNQQGRKVTCPQLRDRPCCKASALLAGWCFGEHNIARDSPSRAVHDMMHTCFPQGMWPECNETGCCACCVCWSVVLLRS